MTNLRAQVILHTVDALSANYITNSWCIVTTDDPTDAEMQEYTNHFNEFYDSLSGILSVPIAQNGHEIKYYDLDQTIPPNYPLAIQTFDLTTNPTAAGLPSEVAVCLSFQGEKVPGSPQRRRRGRVYIGPIAQASNSAGRPSSSLRSTFAASAIELCDDLKGSSNVALLAVWSGTDSGAVSVTDGWIDDSFDTQRRRGVQRTARTEWVAP